MRKRHGGSVPSASDRFDFFERCHGIGMSNMLPFHSSLRPFRRWTHIFPNGEDSGLLQHSVTKNKPDSSHAEGQAGRRATGADETALAPRWSVCRPRRAAKLSAFLWRLPHSPDPLSRDRCVLIRAAFPDGLEIEQEVENGRWFSEKRAWCNSAGYTNMCRAILYHLLTRIDLMF